MNIIADTNIFMVVALGEPERPLILERTMTCELIAPTLLPYELSNALSAMYKQKRLKSNEVVSVFNLASQIPVRLVEINISNALSLAIEYDIYVYDAYFLQAALQYRCALLSLDKKMCQVAQKLNIKLLELN